MNSNALSFLGEFFKHPTKVGAVAPSSQALADEIVFQARVSEAKVIAEFGSGTGSFTTVIVREAPKDAVFIAIELNENLASILQKRLPSVKVYNDSAENLPKMLKECQVDHVDSIVCGLPWAAFSDALQDSLLKAVFDNLRPGGRFVTFAYLQGLLLPAGKKFAKKINQRFAKVEKSRTIWNNFPPAFVYVCTK